MRDYFYKLATDEDKSMGAIFIKACLLLLSFVYALTVRLAVGGYQLGIFKKKHLPRPVISVGNITLGGTGKTPLVQSIVGFLSSKNLKPVILIRGYMDSQNGKGQTKAESDEALLLKRLYPSVQVKVGPNRFQQAQGALQENPVDVFILDDGFQHWRLHRNLDIVIIDCLNPFGNGSVIPRGILREPINSLKRADIFVLTRVGLGAKNVEKIRFQLKMINAAAPIVETAHQPMSLADLRDINSERGLKYLMNKRIAAICAIGNPKSFCDTLAGLGAKTERTFSFIDHHIYQIEDIKQFNGYCGESHVDTLVTTEKDAVKLQPLADAFDQRLTILILKIKIKYLTGENELFDRISHLLQR